MNSALITARSISKTFRKNKGLPVEVLSNLELSVAKGDRIAIIGKSGAGKSTLLQILGTLERPTTGKLLFLGQDVSSVDENRLARIRNQHIGFVFQFHYLLPEFSALENVMMPLVIGNVSRLEAAERARRLLDQVGLDHRIDHKPAQLSGGEQQRVAIARALVIQPKLLLTDEMTGNLDPTTGKTLFELVLQMHKELGMALVSVTHDLQLAQAYSTIYRLEQGRLLSA